MHIAIIGAGVVGLSIAREVAGSGHQVTVLEADRPGAGTTHTSFAWVNSHAKDPLSYHELNMAGVAAHHRLHTTHPDGPRWFHPTGNLEWATTPDHQHALEAALAHLAERGYAAQWIDPARARQLEPGARVPDDAAVAFFPDEGYLLPAVYLGRMLTDTLAGGARLRCPARAREIRTRPGGVEVVLDDGAFVRADVAVSAVGRWTQELAATAGCRVPMATGAATVGYLGYTAPTAVRLGRVVTTSWLNARPEGGGRLVVQGLDLDADAQPGAAPMGPQAPVARALGDRLAGVLTGGEFAEVAQVRVGQRAMPADGLTVCGFADEHQRLYTVATHSGITLAPALGPWVAEEVLTGARRAELADFRPDRFADGGHHREPPPARVPGQQ